MKDYEVLNEMELLALEGGRTNEKLSDVKEYIRNFLIDILDKDDN